MKFAASIWLLGTAFAVLVGALLVWGGVLHMRSIRRFGEEHRLGELVTTQAGSRRAFKGVLLVLAVALAFVALAQPQYGRGTRLIPATNLDVVITLDYSKSMYARDVTPSRIERAKGEVGRLIRELPGARFGAVAFAGEAMKFPLTSDGAAIAQFFRGLTPNDMPVGGTAIARALVSAQELLERDPLSAKHKKVIVLVTDGEDLEGNPVQVAKTAAQDDITIHVVQIGGRTPEPIPEVDALGKITGFRTQADGTPLTTQLTAAGEAQLTEVAQATGGNVVRAERGSTGIEEIGQRLKRMMTEELSEKVETVYADVYAYPLSVAILLLLVECFLPAARKRKKPVYTPPPPRRTIKRKSARKGIVATTLGASVALGLAGGCNGEVDELFTRNSPVVDDAIGALQGGDASVALNLLQEYLATGKCEAGVIGTPPSVHDKPNAAFDLGLALFEIGEEFGQRFGEQSDAGGAEMDPQREQQQASRSEQVECALRIVLNIANDTGVPVDLRARAHYLAGNLEFLRGDYRTAVKHYDKAIQLIPGMPADAGDRTGRDAAYNRAIALRRIQDEPDAAPPDAGQDASQDDSDGGKDAEPDSDSQNDGGPQDAGPDADGGGSGDDDAGADSGADSGASDEPDAGADGGNEPKSGEGPDAGQPPPEQRGGSVNQDERMLDMLEQAPTLQEHEAKEHSGRARIGGMEDK